MDPRRHLVEHAELPEFKRECNQAHVEWMQTFLAAHTASANRTYSSSSLWLGLNTFAGKNLWGLLEEARQIGVALVHSRGQEPVKVAAEPASVGLNLGRYGSGARDGGLELASTITVDGTEVDPASVGTIGRPAHGIFLTSSGDALPGVAADETITLAPLENGLSEELLAFVTAAARAYPGTG